MGPDLSSPADYFAYPAVGSGMVRDWLEASSLGDFRSFEIRHFYLPMLDALRGEGKYVPAHMAPLVDTWESTRTKSTPAMRIGSMIEALLFSNGNGAEWEHASEGATLGETARARIAATRIAQSCPTVAAMRDKVLRGQAETQVAKVATIEGVQVKKREDIVWYPDGPTRAETDFKVWSQWKNERQLGFKIRDSRVVAQRALYRMITKANHPGLELASEILVVNPFISGSLPIEYEHVFTDDELDAAEVDVRRALRGIKAMMEFKTPEEVAA